MHIKWTEDAFKDLDSIYDYISNDNPTTANDVILYIIQSVENLIPLNTAIGRMGRVLGTRELVISNYSYIVPYRVIDNNVIEIIRVIHSSLKWPDRL